MDKLRTEQEIKDELASLLQNDGASYSKILSLSNDLAKFDKDNIRFTVDAGVIDRLGNELVARQETAVSELVKNSYDADSVTINLSFYNSNEVGGRLIISDDGVGMTREQLINGFMRISSTDKKENPFSDKYNRKRAGQKGIGRFAVQRLGEKLTIITQTKDNDEALKLSIDWNDYSSNSELYGITNALESTIKQREFGTTLIIDNLRDRWTEAAIKRIYRYVSDILQPFPLDHNKEKDINEFGNELDPGFKVAFYHLPDGKIRKKISDDKIMIYNHASACIDGMIDEKGNGLYSIVSEKLDFSFEGKIGLDPDNNESLFDKIRNINFRAYYFVYNSDLIPKMHENAIRKLSNVSGGIRLYRNGFRVLPYGEPGNDWLSLDSSTRKRSLLPVHSNVNFFGFVEIDENSGDFEETSSREGLMENESFIQLQNFIYRTIATSVIKIAEKRNVKITTSQRTDEDGNWENIEFRIKNIAFTLDELDRALESEGNNIVTKKKRKKKIVALKKEIEEVSKLQKTEHEKFIKEKSMLRVLSSVGLTVGQFVHEIKYYLDNISDDINFLSKKLDVETQELHRVLILDKNFAVFKTYMSYFNNVVSQNVIRKLKPIELRTVVRPFVDTMKDDAIKSGIKFSEPIYRSFGLYTKPMHPSEWSSILFNFYTNSKKAIKQNSNEGKISIECGEENGVVYLEFSDTGIGIPKEHEEDIFLEFYTTTSQSDLTDFDDNTQIAGTGLGLKIVKDIVKSYRGSIAVVSPKENYSTCIRIEIPKATDKDLDEYGS
jgi:signal transduction histidine kinase